MPLTIKLLRTSFTTSALDFLDLPSPEALTALLASQVAAELVFAKAVRSLAEARGATQVSADHLLFEAQPLDVCEVVPSGFERTVTTWRAKVRPQLEEAIFTKGLPALH